MRHLVRHRADLGACAVFLLAAVVLLWPVLLRGEVLLPADYIRMLYPWSAEMPAPDPTPPWNALLADSVLQYLPWRLFAGDTLRAGFLPLWNPHQFCGTPFFANAQSGVLYPLNLLFWVLPAARAFGYAALLHLFLAGFFLYLYLRVLGLSRPAALVGGLCFELCGFLIAWLSLPTALNVAVWLPLALALYERARAGEGWLRGLPVVLPLAMILLAGHPQFALYSLFAFAAYVLAHLPQGDSYRQRLLGAMACAGVPLVLAALLAAPQLLPTLELSRMSHRSGGSLLIPTATGYRAQGLPAWAAVVLFLPDFFGNPARGNAWGPANFGEFVGYTGVVALILAAITVLALLLPAWRSGFGAAVPPSVPRRAAFFAALAVLAVGAAFRTPLGDLFYALVPGFGSFGSPGRILYLFSVAVAVLAGMGAHALLKGGIPTRVVMAAAAAVAVASTLLAAIASGAAASLGAGEIGEILSVALAGAAHLPVILVLATALMVLAIRGSLSRPITGMLLAGLAAVDLLAFGAAFNQTAPASSAYPPSPTLEQLRAQDPNARFLAITPQWSLTRFPIAVLPPNGAMAYGLYDVNGYDSLYLRHYKEFLDRVAGGDTSPPENGNMVLFKAYLSRDFRLLGCPYVFSIAPIEAEGFQLVADGTVSLYRYTEALPRAYLSAGPDGEPLPGVRADHRPDGPDRVIVDVEGEQSGTLVVLDAYAPGWRAYVDGKPAPIARGRGAFRSVQVPAGARQVTFRYEPTTFRFGLFLGLLALGGVAGAIAYQWQKKRAAATG